MLEPGSHRRTTELFIIARTASHPPLCRLSSHHDYDLFLFVEVFATLNILWCLRGNTQSLPFRPSHMTLSETQLDYVMTTQACTYFTLLSPRHENILIYKIL